MLWRILSSSSLLPLHPPPSTLLPPPSSLSSSDPGREPVAGPGRCGRVETHGQTEGQLRHTGGLLTGAAALVLSCPSQATPAHCHTVTLSHSPWAPQANSHLSQHNQNLQTVFVITWQSPTGDIRPGAGNLFVEETGPTRGTEICHNYHFCLGRLSALLVTQTQLFSLKFIFLGILFTSESDEMKNNIKRITLVLSDWNLQKILLFYLQFCCLLTTK